MNYGTVGYNTRVSWKPNIQVPAGTSTRLEMHVEIALTVLVLALCVYGVLTAHYLRLNGDEHQTKVLEVIYPRAPRTIKWGVYITLFYLLSPIWVPLRQLALDKKAQRT